ncbi:MAG: hypothetical protein C5B48_14755, partial [Candidatus Rokuibacteriota bacterium]
LRVWALGRLRVLRPRSLRYRRESALMARWERAVLEAAAVEYDLGCEVAELGAVIKGYGEVRRRLSRALEHVLDTLPTALARDRDVGNGYARASASTARRGAGCSKTRKELT